MAQQNIQFVLSAKNSLGPVMSSISEGLGKLKGQASSFERGMSRAGSQTQSSFSKIFSTFKSFKTLLPLGGIAVGLGYASKLLASSQEEFRGIASHIRATTENMSDPSSFDRANDSIENLKKTFFDMNSSVLGGQFSLKEMAQAFKIVQASGASTKEALTQLPFVLKAAKVAGDDLSGTVKNLTGIFGAFGIQSEDTASIQKTLDQIIATGTSQFGEMTKALSSIGPQAQTLSSDLPTTISLINELMKAGRSGDEAATELNMLFRTLRNGTPVLNKFFKVDFTTGDFASNLKVLHERIGSMQLSGEEYGVVMNEAFNNASKTMFSLLDGMNNLSDVQKKISSPDIQGKFQRNFDIDLQTTVSSFTALRNEFNLMIQSLGTDGGLLSLVSGFLNILTKLVRYVTSASRALGSLRQHFKEGRGIRGFFKKESEESKQESESFYPSPQSFSPQRKQELISSARAGALAPESPAPQFSPISNVRNQNTLSGEILLNIAAERGLIPSVEQTSFSSPSGLGVSVRTTQDMFSSFSSFNRGLGVPGYGR